MQRVCAALNHAEAATKVPNRGLSEVMFSARASRLPAMDLMGASELESSCPSTRIRRFQAICSSSCNGRLTSAKQQQRVRRAILAESALCAAASAGRFRAEGVNGLVGRAEQILKAEFARAAAKAAGS